MQWTIPNQLTVLRILLTPLFVFFYSQEDFTLRLVGAACFFLAALSDWYDGYIARRFGVITRFGQFMDPLADKILVLTAFFLLVWMKILPGWMVLIIAIRDIFITLVRIFAIETGSPIVTHLVAKWKTFLQMSFLFYLILLYTFIPFNPGWHHILSVLSPIHYWILFGITLITVFSLFQYIYENYNLIGRLMKYLIRWVNR